MMTTPTTSANDDCYIGNGIIDNGESQSSGLFIVTHMVCWWPNTKISSLAFDLLQEGRMEGVVFIRSFTKFQFCFLGGSKNIKKTAPFYMIFFTCNPGSFLMVCFFWFFILFLSELDIYFFLISLFNELMVGCGDVCIFKETEEWKVCHLYQISPIFNFVFSADQSIKNASSFSLIRIIFYL